MKSPACRADLGLSISRPASAAERLPEACLDRIGGSLSFAPLKLMGGSNSGERWRSLLEASSDSLTRSNNRANYGKRSR